MENEPLAPRKADSLLRLIAFYKLCKAALLLAIGLGVLRLVHTDLAALAQRWVESLAMSPARRAAERLIALVSGLSPRGLEVLAGGAFLYAGLYLVEGVGLWFARRWAEYLVLCSALLFVPFEVYALARRATLPRSAALILNLVVAAYLIHCLRRNSAAARRHGGREDGRVS
jgi:uncharacterized membrane protein (DUF2068 family)